MLFYFLSPLGIWPESSSSRATKTQILRTTLGESPNTFSRSRKPINWPTTASKSFPAGPMCCPFWPPSGETPRVLETLNSLLGRCNANGGQGIREPCYLPPSMRLCGEHDWWIGTDYAGRARCTSHAWYPQMHRPDTRRYIRNLLHFLFSFAFSSLYLPCLLAAGLRAM